MVVAVTETVGTEAGSDAGRLGGIKISMMIANHQCLLWVAIKLEQCLLQWIRVGLFVGKGIATDDRAKKAGEAKALENSTSIEDRLIGDQRHTLWIMTRQQFFNAGVAVGLVKQVLAIEFEKTLQMLRLIMALPESPFDQHGRSVTNHVCHLGGRQWRETQLVAEQVDGGQQIGHRVDQGTVEVKK